MIFADYVLGKFSKEDRVLMEEGYDLACEASALSCRGAIDQAMNEYNQKKERIRGGKKRCMHLRLPLSELAEIEEICEERGREPGMPLLSGCVTSQKTHLMYALGKDYGHTLIVLSSEDKAKKLYEEYRFLNENTSYYPAKDLLFYQADIHGKQLVKQRMETLQMMMEAKSQVTVITTIDGFMDELPSEAEIKGDILTISNGEALEFESLKEKIIKLGYDREAQVDAIWGSLQFVVESLIFTHLPRNCRSVLNSGEMKWIQYGLLTWTARDL